MRGEGDFRPVCRRLLLLVLSPLMLAGCSGDQARFKGPRFFRQQRFGFNNNLIGVYKFRSMYADKADMHARKQVTRMTRA